MGETGKPSRKVMFFRMSGIIEEQNIFTLTF